MTIFLMVLCFSAPVFAQISDEILSSASQEELQAAPIAFEGYDVITYFSPGGLKVGTGKFQTVYLNQRYLFSTHENQEIFMSDPERYLPEFGEYCGCGASEEKWIRADPEIFKVIDGNLILFENPEALSLWNKDEERRYQKARDFWKYENKYDADKRLREDSTIKLFSF